MAYKYLYIDDTKDKLEEGMINALTDGGDIEIKFQNPADWEDLIDWLKGKIPDYDGVILDLRLNDTAYEVDKFAKYKGSTVAQELRSLTKEGDLRADFPIVLFSGTDKIETYLDPTSRDLFDMIVDKTKIAHPGYMSYADFKSKLMWLSDGYKFLNTSEKKVETVLGITDSSIIDSRFVDLFGKLLNKPIHIVAQFLIKEVLQRPCFLISESYLAARLGVKVSSNEWSQLMDIFEECKYKGAFGTHYSQWWMPLVNHVWEERISQDTNLRSLSARDRVKLIMERTGLTQLETLEKTDKSKSDSFWVTCKATGVAIDTIDGFVIAGQDNKFPWQEPEYISINEAVRPTKEYFVTVTERPRLQKLKALLEKNEQRVRQ